MRVHKLVMAAMTFIIAGAISGCSNSSGVEKQKAASVKTEVSETENKGGESGIKLITSTSHMPGGASQLLQVNMTKVFDDAGFKDYYFEHYDSASLYKSSAELGALLDGNIDIGFIQMGYFYDNGSAWANMYDIAFLYKDIEHMEKVLDMDGVVGSEIQQRLWDEMHIRAVAPYYMGVRDVWLRDGSKAVNTPEDLKGVKIRMPNSASFLDMGAALGAEATPLDSGETYLAMSTGTVDAQENNTLQSYNNAMQEVTKSIVKTEHMITANIVCINGDVWEKMTTEQQKKITELIKEACSITTAEVKEKEDEIFEECKTKYGIIFQEPDKKSFREYAMNFYLSKDENKKNWDLDVLEAINKLGEE